ncbi:hypothetical protein Ahia01_000769100 [Argonauta hians]
MKSSKENCSASGIKFDFETNRTECNDMTSILKLMDELFRDNVDNDFCQNESLQTYVSRMADELKRSASILPAFLGSLSRLNINLHEFKTSNHILTRLLENSPPSMMTFPYNGIIEELKDHKSAILTLINKVEDLRADFLLDKKNEDVLHDNYIAKKTAERFDIKSCKLFNFSGKEKTTQDTKPTEKPSEQKSNFYDNIETTDPPPVKKETTSHDKDIIEEGSNIRLELDIQVPRRGIQENVEDYKISGKVYRSEDCGVNIAVKNGSTEGLEKLLLFQDDEMSVLRKLTSCMMNLIARCQYLEEEKDTIMRSIEQAKACSQTICGNLHQQITALRGKYEILQATLTLLLNKFEHDATSRVLSIPVNDTSNEGLKPKTLSNNNKPSPTLLQFVATESDEKADCEKKELFVDADITELHEDQISNVDFCDQRQIADSESALPTNDSDLEKDTVALLDKELAKLHLTK